MGLGFQSKESLFLSPIPAHCGPIVFNDEILLCDQCLTAKRLFGVCLANPMQGAKAL